MTTQTINEKCEAVIAVPRDGGSWERFTTRPGRTTALIKRLERTGRYKGLFLHFKAPGARAGG